jgi:hypothetical protein
MTIYGTTTGMRDDYAVSCAPAGAPDVVLGFTAPATATYFFDTAGSDFDTVLSLRTGGCEGSELTCNDDARDLTSAITTYLLAGQRVGIVVDGYSGAHGSFTLDVRSDRESPISRGHRRGGTGGSPREAARTAARAARFRSTRVAASRTIRVVRTPTWSAACVRCSPAAANSLWTNPV